MNNRQVSLLIVENNKTHFKGLSDVQISKLVSDSGTKIIGVSTEAIKKSLNCVIRESLILLESNQRRCIAFLMEMLIYSVPVLIFHRSI